jgi:hypothetical protein
MQTVTEALNLLKRQAAHALRRPVAEVTTDDVESGACAERVA